MVIRRLRLSVIVSVLALVAFLAGAPSLHARADVPARLSDAEFWKLTDDLSEDNGQFRSDNFLSNENGYQFIIPDLISRVKPGGVYLGVAPEINFTYIVATKPRMAFIIDIRRGNLHEHLLYKALFEMSADRADFLSRLFSRKRPAGLSGKATPAELFAAYDLVEPNEGLYKENLKAVIDWLTKKHEFHLRLEDPDGIAYVYHDAFFAGGPNLDYSFGSSLGMGGRNTPTYQQLMQAEDGTGQNRGFLASDENFTFIKDFEAKNLLVPVVGNFGGPKAIRAVGNYVKEKGGTVTTFYLSNVEQYLVGGLWENFCASVATLPLDETSTYIYSGRGAPGGPGGFGGRGGFGGGGGYGRGFGGMGSSRTRPMLSEVKNCAGR
jgi:hypothetical protein